jgi:lipopolysaccharide/colanic/teichoic acid biosynthesis glycosyltransferase
VIVDIQIECQAQLPLAQVFKRVIDVTVALASLAILSPLLLFIAGLIRIESQGSVIFRQLRVGKGGVLFTLYKFRTMREPDNGRSDESFIEHEEDRLKFSLYQKLATHPRLTTVGRILRRTSLDELPQLWNVINGEMSLVGPRPFLPEQTQLYGPPYVDYIQMRPGITGLWQVSGRNKLSFFERVDCDEYYFCHQSLGFDFVILVKTIWVVICQDGAY